MPYTAAPLHLNGLTIQPGERVLTRLVISKLPSGTVIDVPVHVLRATEPGPTLLLMGGMHGDEVNGIETIRRMVRRELLQPLRGTIIAIPILNIYGFLNFSREVPDGKDVNRSFPGFPRGSLAGRVAHRFMREIMPLIDYGIDFHTGGAARANFPQVRAVLGLDAETDALAAAFAAPFTLHAALRAGSLREAAQGLVAEAIRHRGIDLHTPMRGRDIVRMVHAVNSGHPGGSLGCTDLLVALYFKIMKHNPAQFSMDGVGEDLFFLSNGHISPVFYSVLARAGYFPVSELATFRKLDSRLQGHPTTHEGLPGVRVASGSRYCATSSAPVG